MMFSNQNITERLIRVLYLKVLLFKTIRFKLFALFLALNRKTFFGLHSRKQYGDVGCDASEIDATTC